MAPETYKFKTLWLIPVTATVNGVMSEWLTDLICAKIVALERSAGSPFASVTAMVMPKSAPWSKDIFWRVAIS